MGTLLVILAIIIFVCLVLVAAMHPVRPEYSLAELKRRAKKSEKFTLELDRFELHAGVVTLLRSIRAVFVVILTCLFIGAFGWLLGVFIALVAALLYPIVARLKSVKRGAQSIYLSMEGGLLDFVARFERVIHAFREPATNIHEPVHELHSREELGELIEHSKTVIGENERKLLVSALSFPDKTVQEIMTPRKNIKTISKGEFLGPLVLDELHALGHSRLPVIDGDLDHVVGLLHLGDMLSLDVKHSSTAEKAMEPKVYYVRKDDTLEHALAVFLKVRHHLLIVTDDESNTVGLITLDDLVETLIGRKIDSEA